MPTMRLHLLVLGLFFTLSSFASLSNKKIDFYLNQVTNTKFYNNNQWQALLHIDNSNIYFEDSFYLSAPNINSKDELLLTLKAILDTKNKNHKYTLCHTPARTLWLINKLKLPTSISSSNISNGCKELQEYETRVKREKVSLVYVSDKVDNPMSMMGHVLIKIGGKYKGKEVFYSTSYHAIINTINPVKVLYQNIYSGMKGIFALSPYESKEREYNLREDRAVWEYGLNLSEFENTILYYHLWELRGIKSKYFFVSNNCATFTDTILKSAIPRYKNINSWITPISVVRAIWNSSVVDSMKIKPSDFWSIQASYATRDKKAIKNIKNYNFKALKSKDKNKEFIDATIAIKYLNIEYRDKNVDGARYNRLSKDILSILNKHPNKALDYYNYKNPINRKPSAQVGFGGMKTSILNEEFAEEKIENSSYFIDYAPAITRLEDSSKNKFGENELRLFNLNIKYDNQSKKIKLDSLTLAGMKTLLPFNSLIKKYSWQYSIKANQQINTQISEGATSLLSLGANFDIGGGLASYLSRDITIYSMLGLGATSFSSTNRYGYSYLEIGGVINEIGGMRTVLSFKQQYLGKDFFRSDILEMKQSIEIGNSYSLVAKLKMYRYRNKKQTDIGIKINKYF